VVAAIVPANRHRNRLDDVPVLTLGCDPDRLKIVRDAAVARSLFTLRFAEQLLFGLFGFGHFRGYEQEQLPVLVIHARQESYQLAQEPRFLAGGTP
jgi:hypothetical protein